MSEYDGNLGADKVLKGIGPREFVNLISRADRIYTDSYHACAFSLIFGKAFTVYKRFPYSVPENPNARVDELLSAFGLGGERCNVESFGGDREAYVPIIERMREFSLNYLFNSVEGI